MDRVVVTAVDTQLFNDYQLFYDSLRRVYSGPVVVFDLGLSAEQTLSGVDARQYQKQPIESWQRWVKPLLISQAGGTQRLWIDCDTAVLRPLDQLFAALDESPYFVCDAFAPNICYNDPSIYGDSVGREVPINSGVVGVALPRDSDLLALWARRCQECLDSDELRSKVSLYDQGALIWAIRELGLSDCAQTSKTWNWPAKRNPYELTPQPRWPSGEPTRLGGTLLQQIAADNPGAGIVHYAGRPKLSDLLKPNSHGVRHGQFSKISKTLRIFGVGMERCGTHSLAEMVRAGSDPPSWVRHEYEPPLAHEARLLLEGGYYHTDSYRSRLALFRRKDCEVVCEVNHRLVFFVKQIAIKGDAKFVFLYREPVSLVRSRLLNHIVWADQFPQLPAFYLADVLASGKDKSPQNIYRIRPPGPFDLIGWHIWEICKTVDFSMAALRRLPEEQVLIVRTDELIRRSGELAEFCGLPKKPVTQAAHTRAGCYYGQCSKESEEWIDALVAAPEILRVIGDTYRSWGLPLAASPII